MFIQTLALYKSFTYLLTYLDLHKEPSLNARLELFATNITVLEMFQRFVSQVCGCDSASSI